jgi:hypothetical protein
MDRKGIALISALFLVLVLSILLVGFFFKTMTETNLVSRYAGYTRAFWLAEAGVAEGIMALPNNTSGCVGDTNHCYSVATSQISSLYYQIDSLGSVSLPSGGSVNRGVSAVVRTEEVDPTKFQFAIETTVELVIKGSVDINPDGSAKEFSDLNFPDLFGHSKEDIRSYADNLYSDPDNNILPCSGITWIDLSPGEEFMITSNLWQGSGILVVAGDAQITGGQFDGIIYVIGKLRIAGNPILNGSILAESDTEVVDDTTLTGNPTLNYDPTAISNAMDLLKFISPEIVSWRES